MALNSMKVGTRLSLGFGLVLTLLLFIAALGVFNMSTIHAKLDVIVNENGVKGELVENMLLYVLKADPDFQKFIKKLPVGAAAELDEYMRRLSGRKTAAEDGDF